MAKFTPPCDREHPPFNSSKDNKVGGVHGASAGPLTYEKEGNTVQTSNQANAVERPPNGIRTK